MIQNVSAGIEGERAYSLLADPAAAERAGGQAADQSDRAQSAAGAAPQPGNRSTAVTGNGRINAITQSHGKRPT